MVKVFTACSPLLVALTVAGIPAGAQTADPEPRQVTVVGCIAQNGHVDPDKGIRVLNIAPKGLALMGARVSTNVGTRTSAVPGSTPDGRNSGTIPNQSIVAPGTEPGPPLSFELSGAHLADLEAQVGSRVEIVGRTKAAAPGDSAATQPRGTSGTDATTGQESARGEGPTSGTGTREERPGARVAHPSTEFQPLEVTSFRRVSGACE